MVRIALGFVVGGVVAWNVRPAYDIVVEHVAPVYEFIADAKDDPTWKMIDFIK
ncbi:hypothetical protein Lepto7375DRAFT_1786 [Leptolyngbya sp. PCC 7375]|nr:hypothetical protein Lepto7375DRAFT_1786 [Leptolyngbya sp. PCC 7375]